MINTIVHIEEIEFEEKDPGSLLDSIEKRGIAIPVHVEKIENGYRCIDGHKRLSAAKMLYKKEERFARIPIMILNDFSKSGSSFWGNTQNKH
ncbi:MAG: ParB-like nuclease domain-containing protein [Solobacterium sp.]|nr:ParB-like nuclease domain-containing protein [Solobacterium sp.]